MSIIVDLNCDMGESYGRFTVGNDTSIFPHISSSNIACGFHGGDPLHIEKTIRMALDHGLRIGAHPGYPDLAGFGRRYMQIPLEDLRAIIKYQIAALKGMTESLGGKLSYVKPHGALYNAASKDPDISSTIIQAIQEMDPQLSFMGLAGSIMESTARTKAQTFIAEAFADRRYEPDGRLMSRAIKDAVIHDANEAVQQVLSMVTEQKVQCSDGTYIAIQAQSYCIHGDNPAAVPILEALNQAFAQRNILKKAK